MSRFYNDFAAIDISEDELAHYGVLGMKWGVRHDKKALRKNKKQHSKNRNTSNNRNSLDDFMQKVMLNNTVIDMMNQQNLENTIRVNDMINNNNILVSNINTMNDINNINNMNNMALNNHFGMFM